MAGVGGEPLLTPSGDSTRSERRADATSGGVMSTQRPVASAFHQWRTPTKMRSAPDGSSRSRSKTQKPRTTLVPTDASARRVAFANDLSGSGTTPAAAAAVSSAADGGSTARQREPRRWEPPSRRLSGGHERNESGQPSGKPSRRGGCVGGRQSDSRVAALAHSTSSESSPRSRPSARLVAMLSPPGGGHRVGMQHVYVRPFLF